MIHNIKMIPTKAIPFLILQWVLELPMLLVKNRIEISLVLNWTKIIFILQKTELRKSKGV